MELLELFDVKERRLKKKIVRGFEPKEGEYIMVVYLFIQNNEGKILLEKSAATKTWVVPGGHVNHGKPLDNVKRECYEELGINIENEQLKVIDTITTSKYIFKIYYLKKDISISDIKIQKDEILSAKYFSIKEIDKMIDDGFFRPNNVIFIDCLKKYLH